MTENDDEDDNVPRTVARPDPSDEETGKERLYSGMRGPTDVATATSKKPVDEDPDDPDEPAEEEPPMPGADDDDDGDTDDTAPGVPVAEPGDGEGDSHVPDEPKEDHDHVPPEAEDDPPHSHDQSEAADNRNRHAESPVGSDDSTNQGQVTVTVDPEAALLLINEGGWERDDMEKVHALAKCVATGEKIEFEARYEALSALM